MITIVAPESAPWLMPILEGAVELGPVTVIAPWAQLSALPPWMPQRLHRYVARRRLPALSLSVLRLPGFAAAELGMRAWTGSRAERLLAGRFARRALTDRLSAVCLPHQTRLVIAPSCGARRVFARARDQGAATVLIEDLPNLRRLHRDLDVACGRHPRSSFLRRYRAPARTLARQEAERVLAQRIVVRGAFAADLLRAAGIQDHKLAGFQVPVEAPKPVTVRLDPPRVLLAGLATGRSGVVEALSAVEQVPGARLLVRAGEGLEPADLLAHPQVQRAGTAALERLDGVDLVLAPAWCESYPRPVQLAAAAGVPVLATSRAAGFAVLPPDAALDPGDATSIAGALGRVIATATPATLPPISTVFRAVV